MNHGVLIAGSSSLRRAADMTEIAEHSAQVILGCHALGREQSVPPAVIAAEPRALGGRMA